MDALFWHVTFQFFVKLLKPTHFIFRPKLKKAFQVLSWVGSTSLLKTDILLLGACMHSAGEEAPKNCVNLPVWMVIRQLQKWHSHDDKDDNMVQIADAAIA